MQQNWQLSEYVQYTKYTRLTSRLSAMPVAIFASVFALKGAMTNTSAH